MSNLIDRLNNLPNESGIYKYIDSNLKLLYVGKAKNLKNRIKSYFNLSQTLELKQPIPNPKVSQRIAIMVKQIYNLEFVITNNEQDALILENSLIKQLKPKYNILLRDDKTYPYIALNLNDDFPFPFITRVVLKDKNIKYFGPYPNGAKELLESILELFPLVQKKSCKNAKKVCLFYQINRCLGPCENYINKDEYRHILDSSLKALKSPQKILNLLKEKMNFLSENLRFEEALTYRERIKKINLIQNNSSVDFANSFNLDVYNVEYINNRAVLVSLFVRNGKIIATDSQLLYFEYGFNLEEIFIQHILNHYEEKLPLIPSEILLPLELDVKDKELLENFISIQQDKKITISNPKKGDKEHLLQLALKNAKETLNQLNQKLHIESKIIKEIKDLLNLDSIPSRIEVFDTSHHLGSQKVGAMVVYENGEFIKNDYRKFILESSDEYGQMKEMLTRRALKFSESLPPDLWLIDGGKAQINIAKEVIDSSGFNVSVIGIAKQKVDSKAYRAKGAASDTIYTESGFLKLDSSDLRLQFLQKLRDEAHRFAIKFHRESKKRDLTNQNELSKKGLNQNEIKRLLSVKNFSELKDLDSSELKDLAKSIKRIK